MIKDESKKSVWKNGLFVASMHFEWRLNMSPRKKKIIIQEEHPFGICPLSVVSIYRFPDKESTLLSQILFGEQVQVLERKGKHWLKISCDWDGVSGWVDSKQVVRIPEEEYNQNKEHLAYSLELVHGAMGSSESIPICLGSSLTRFDGINCKLPSGKFAYTGQVMFNHIKEVSSVHLVKIAKKFMQAPELKGGRSPFGIDSSGLMQLILKIMGIKFPRYAHQQIEFGEMIDFPINSKVGDIAFFEDSKKRVIHSGLVIDEQKLLHCYGKVRIDHFDHHGIYNSDLGKYTHKLRIIKRIRDWQEDETNGGYSDSNGTSN